MTRLLPFLAALLLAACATAPVNTAGPRPAAYREQIELEGQIAVRYSDARDQPQTLSGTYRWVQQGERTDVTLLSPLGQIVALIRVAPGQATLQQANQPLKSAADIDTLTTEALGWPLPVGGLRDWLQGRAVDAQGKPYVATRAQDTVTTRDGWRIRYVWHEGAETLQRVELERAMPGQPTPVSLRITLAQAN